MNLIACTVCGSPSSHLPEIMLAAALALVACSIATFVRRRQTA